MRDAAHAHNLECVDLLGDLHRPDLRCDVGPHLARQNHRDNGGRKLQNHGLSNGKAYGIGGNPASNLMGRLNGNDRAHEQTEQGNNAHTLNPDGLELYDRRIHENLAFLRAAQSGCKKGEEPSNVEEKGHAVKTKVSTGRGDEDCHPNGTIPSMKQGPVPCNLAAMVNGNPPSPPQRHASWPQLRRHIHLHKHL